MIQEPGISISNLHLSTPAQSFPRKGWFKVVLDKHRESPSRHVRRSIRSLGWR
jgi:hypothetical protein